MQTKSVGQILKEERLQHGYSLADMASATRIKLKYLKHLEANRFKQLPAATFVKGFIRAYARILDFDHQPLIALLRRDFKQSAQGRLLPREFINPVRRQRTQFWQPVTLILAAAATIFLVLFGYIGWQWYSLNRPPQLEVYSPQENEFVSSQVEVRGATEQEAIITVNAQPVAIKPDGTFRTSLYLPKEGIATITIEATDKRGKTNLEQRTVYVRF
jgi:cytoskeleton protein RodZ